MLRRGLITQQVPGRGVNALFFPACYKVSASLDALLAARRSPAFMIATHHESRTPAVTYFQLRGTGAIVQEIPDRADKTRPGQLTINGNGSKAQITGPDIAATLTREELTVFMTSAVTQWVG